MSTKIMIADDHKIMRQGLRALLESQPGCSVVGEAENGRKAVQLVREVHPDIIIMDITMHDLNGIEATRRIKSSNPTVRVIGLSIHSDRRFVVEMFKAGASGYLLKDCAFEELAGAIRSVSDGKAYVSPSIAGLVIGEALVNMTSKAPPGIPSLSSREREVLQLMAEGKTTKEIALVLQLSVKTVETHRKQIQTKLGMNSIAELTKYAIREGLTSL